MAGEDEELDWREQPAQVLRYDVADGEPRRLRLFFDLVGDYPPGPMLSSVKIVETGTQISGLVLRREPEGQRLDGPFYGSKLIDCFSCVQIELRWPFDAEQVIDASTGHPVERLNRNPTFDPEQGSLDGVQRPICANPAIAPPRA